eukprot:TRINITY_DN6717_c0_g2_i3.p2 TRINITY_DN6717_c0_g2~~TRINITY_DN6717_c0_g2_i3.p2  ORF type:complete len:197 (-),score=-25.06 TRINITY_DN6717_c0_g2_i3:363-953(-)
MLYINKVQRTREFLCVGRSYQFCIIFFVLILYFYIMQQIFLQLTLVEILIIIKKEKAKSKSKNQETRNYKTLTQYLIKIENMDDRKFVYEQFKMKKYFYWCKCRQLQIRCQQVTYSLDFQAQTTFWQNYLIYYMTIVLHFFQNSRVYLYIQIQGLIHIIVQQNSIQPDRTGCKQLFTLYKVIYYIFIRGTTEMLEF